ncbi:2-dehydropantoate 2-reductase [Parafrigoribacterium mesophilum]|uniref:ketopantoate reductase family protein n=1 Tax=Parafrigoribacterium mesophilum TaxID=433646 RepID=UPI0031FCD298
MRVAVLGAGAIGGTIAALLFRGGHQVAVTARGDNLRALRSGQLRLDGAWGSVQAHVTASETLTTAPELAFVTTKVQDAESAMLGSAGVLGGIPVVVVQNGMRGVQTAERVLPDSPIVGGLALYAASYLGPGRVAVTTAGPTYLGAPSPASGAALARAAEALGAVMPVSTTDNFVGAQWTKLVVNQINALPAITGMSAQEVISHPGLRRLLTRSIRELVRAAQAGGVRFAPLQGLTDGMLRMLGRMPLSIGQLLPQLMKVRMGATPNPGSTLQSIRHGQITEIDYLNGAVVEAGERAGVATPVNRALVELVHEVERTHVFVAPDEILRRIRT